MSVPAGSYVLPSDIPSALGQGNSVAGGDILDKMFKGGPYGMKPMRGGKGGGSRMPAMQSLRGKGFADGGEAPEDQGHVQIIAAGYAYLVPPDVVRIGHGSLTAGHKVLDAFVLHTRKENIKTLRKLPPPKK